MPSATLTSKGQVTIPKEVREALGLKTGDWVDFQPTADGGFRLEPRRLDARTLAGILHREGRRAVTVEQMNEVIEKQHTRAARKS